MEHGVRFSGGAHNRNQPGASPGSLAGKSETPREMFVNGVSELESVFQTILSPSTLAELKRIAGLREQEFHYSAELWVRTVYEFAAAYQKSVINRDHIIQALAPLFRGKSVHVRRREPQRIRE